MLDRLYYKKAKTSKVCDLGKFKTTLLTQCIEIGILDAGYVARGMVVYEVNLPNYCLVRH